METMIDETSSRVLLEYIRDSRQSFREVARTLGVSSGTVASRIKEMEEKGIIKRYSVLMDLERLGYELTILSEIIVSDGMMMEVGERIAGISDSLAVYNITGDSDIMVVAKFKTRQDLSDYTKMIHKMPYVLRTKTHVVLNTIKEDFNQLP
jgi:DNA-binding Lrp family transcriptional regulator